MRGHESTHSRCSGAGLRLLQVLCLERNGCSVRFCLQGPALGLCACSQDTTRMNPGPSTSLLGHDHVRAQRVCNLPHVDALASTAMVMGHAGEADAQGTGTRQGPPNIQLPGLVLTKPS